MPSKPILSKVVWLPLLVLLANAINVSVTRGDEFSITPDSTVIGQNYGYPSGTPSQGLPSASQVDLVVETTVFAKNLELEGLGAIEGETFIGVLAPLRLRYAADEKVSIEVGAVLGHNFGDDNKLDIAEPIFRIVIEPFNDVFFVAGTIFPTHWIHDALHDDVQKFRTNTEQGFQLRIDHSQFKHDSWINWRIREGEIRPEEFEVGSASQIRLFDDILRLDAQAMVDHAGGQISSSPRVETNFTLLGGASVGIRNPFGWSSIQDARIGGAYFYSSEDINDMPRLTGEAWEVRGNLDLSPIDWTWVRLHIGYFNGNDFLARRGDPLYGLDDYVQGGITALVGMGSDLRIEAGFVIQDNDGNTNYTFQVNVSWGNAFNFDFLKPRVRQQTADTMSNRGLGL
ncbi:MAG: hypothetical protein OEU26_18930 [Candidatus Tectomicrobia bacterium]|nr:hypothetical protein [Candidatus Tectomicrobia bacterium]